MNTPSFHTGFGDDDAAALSHGDKVLENERITPGHGLGWIADSAIFIAIWIFHQDRADPIGTQLRAKRPVILPQTFIVVADLWPVMIDRATLALKAMFAEVARGLCKFFDLKHLAAEAAFGAGFSGNRHHLNYAWRTGPIRIGFWTSSTVPFDAQEQKTAYARLSFYTSINLPREDDT
jgi:hypothetical protein